MSSKRGDYAPFNNIWFGRVFERYIKIQWRLVNKVTDFLKGEGINRFSFMIR